MCGPAWMMFSSVNPTEIEYEYWLFGIKFDKASFHAITQIDEAQNLFAFIDDVLTERDASSRDVKSDGSTSYSAYDDSEDEKSSGDPAKTRRVSTTRLSIS